MQRDLRPVRKTRSVSQRHSGGSNAHDLLAIAQHLRLNPNLRAILAARRIINIGLKSQDRTTRKAVVHVNRDWPRASRSLRSLAHLFFSLAQKQTTQAKAGAGEIGYFNPLHSATGT